jgi:hypothetical protein
MKKENEKIKKLENEKNELYDSFLRLKMTLKTIKKDRKRIDRNILKS